MHRSYPPLTGARSLLLPSHAQTLLLRSALLPANEAEEAIAAWQAQCADPVAAIGARDGGGRRLAPLIAANLGQDCERLAPTLKTYLRTAAVREELRAREYRKICHGVLLSLARAELDVIALKGVVLAETAYPNPSLRHSHDIDVLVREDEIERARSVAIGIDFQASAPYGTNHLSSDLYVHASGLPLSLHTRLFAVEPYNDAQPEMASRAEHRTILDAPVRVLSHADELLHVCVHAATGWQRSTLSWVCDAWFIVDRYPDLDWDVLADSAVRGRMSIPAHAMLTYLKEELGASVPASCLERLTTGATEARRVMREVALFGAWAGPKVKFPRAIRNTRTWPERFSIAAWRLLPSPASVKATGRIPKRSAWPLWYIGRPFRFVAYRLRALAGRNVAPTLATQTTTGPEISPSGPGPP